MQSITEDKAREIHNAKDLTTYSYDQLVAADQFIKAYALDRLEQVLASKGIEHVIGEYIMLMSRCHFGSVETDEFLTSLGCYPAWMD